MTATHVMQMTQRRQMRVQRIQEPKTTDVRHREIGEPFVALPSTAGERGTPCGQSFDQTFGQVHHRLAGGEIEQRWHERLVEAELARGRSQHARDRQRDEAIRVFAFHQKTQTRRRNLDRALGQARCFVAHQLLIRVPARQRAVAAPRDIARTGSVLWDGEIAEQGTLVRREGLIDHFGRWSRAARGHVEQQSVGEATGGRADDQRAASERFVVER